MNFWTQQVVLSLGKDVKHSERWDCAACGTYLNLRLILTVDTSSPGKPARETHMNVMSWIHLPQPRMNIYVHFFVSFLHIINSHIINSQIHLICDAGGGECHKAIERQTAMMAVQAGQTPQSTPILPKGPGEFPLAASCAKCCQESTGLPDSTISRCGGCKLIRLVHFFS
jgi:hypothetical protein